MSTTVKDKAGNPPQSSGAAKSSAVLPDIEIRFSPLYAWLLIGFGVLFFFVGLLFVAPHAAGRNVGLAILICAASLAGILGGNYWRHHLPVMVRMTPRHLLLPRAGLIEWTDIVAIEKKTITAFSHGVRSTPEYVGFKLKNQPAKNNRLNEAFLKVMKSAVLGGYDVVINPENELLRNADWFIAECRKRMPTAEPKS